VPSDDWLSTRDVEYPMELEQADLRLGPLNRKVPGDISSRLCREAWVLTLEMDVRSEALESPRTWPGCGFGTAELLLKNPVSTL
jgi:hypothetical protein